MIMIILRGLYGSNGKYDWFAEVIYNVEGGLLIIGKVEHIK
jgi:hypothetical protein